MNCPSCGVEMGTLNAEYPRLCRCAECGSLWIELWDLNRLLLQNNLPGLDSLGGKLHVDSLLGQCPECLVDLVEIRSKHPQHPLAYASCESCGGILIIEDFSPCATAEEALQHLVHFFAAFHNPGKRSPLRH